MGVAFFSEGTFLWEPKEHCSSFFCQSYLACSMICQGTKVGISSTRGPGTNNLFCIFPFLNTLRQFVFVPLQFLHKIDTSFGEGTFSGLNKEQWTLLAFLLVLYDTGLFLLQSYHKWVSHFIRRELFHGHLRNIVPLSCWQLYLQCADPKRDLAAAPS